MMSQPPRRRGTGSPHPLRTCIGCRRALPQAALLRVARTPDGFVEPDPRRRGRGRGAYLCFREECLTETVRRGRWAHAFRASVTARPEAIERLRALLGERARTGASGQSVEGGW